MFPVMGSIRDLVKRQEFLTVLRKATPGKKTQDIMLPSYCSSLFNPEGEIQDPNQELLLTGNPLCPRARKFASLISPRMCQKIKKCRL